MKKLSKTKIVIITIVSIILANIIYILYIVFFYEDTRWNATINLPPEQLKIFRDNLNK